MFVIDSKTMEDMAEAFEETFQTCGPTWFVDEAIQQTTPLTEGFDNYMRLSKVVSSEQKAKLKWKLTRTKFVAMVVGEEGIKKCLVLPRGHALFRVAERHGHFNSEALKAIHTNVEYGVWSEKEMNEKKEE